MHHCCSQSKCYYIEGGCLSSPRWLSLLVAEIYYPDAYLPPDSRPSVPRSPVQGGEPPATPLHYQQFSSRAGVAADKTAAKPHCDGVDDLGCFQVSPVLPNQLLILVLPLARASYNVPFLNPLRLGRVCGPVRLYDHWEWPQYFLCQLRILFYTVQLTLYGHSEWTTCYSVSMETVNIM